MVRVRRAGGWWWGGEMVVVVEVVSGRRFKFRESAKIGVDGLVAGRSRDWSLEERGGIDLVVMRRD